MLTLLISENHPLISSLGVVSKHGVQPGHGDIVNTKKVDRRESGVSILTNHYVNKFQRISS